MLYDSTRWVPTFRWAVRWFWAGMLSSIEDGHPLKEAPGRGINAVGTAYHWATRDREY